jgi:hypothetical protein
MVPPSNSDAQVVRMTQHLDDAQVVAKTDLGGCLNDLAGRLGRREIVMIFSDFFGDLAGLESALQRFRYSRHEVVLFPILHHDELTFELSGLTRFVGLEPADPLLVRPDDVRDRYLAAVRRFLDRLEELAGRNGCECLLVDSRRPLADVLVDYLNQRRQASRVSSTAPPPARRDYP